MGVYSGVITFAIALWFHQSAVQFNRTVGDEDKKSAWMCFWLGAGTFFSGIIIGFLTNFVIVEIKGGMAVGIGDAFGQASGADTGPLAIFFELLPLSLALLLSYCVREWWVVKKQLALPGFLSKLLKKSD